MSWSSLSVSGVSLGSNIYKALKSNENKKKNGKIPKQAVGYVFNPETQYQCGVCVYSKNKDFPNETKKCKILGPTENISKYGSCILWIHMDPTREGTPEIPYIDMLTKQHVDYGENEMGFSCKRCVYFEPGKMDCKKVDKDDPDGITPGIIHPNACCNHWESDPIRANMSTEEVNEYMQKKMSK